MIKTQHARLYKSLQRFTQLYRKLVKALFNRKRPLSIYVPSFDIVDIASRVGNPNHENLKGNETSEHHQIAFNVARRARSTFGKRFFVDPENVLQLLEKARSTLPDQILKIRKRVVEDVETGTPIYSNTGPKLGADFSWRSLPLGPGSDALYAVRPHRFAFAPRHALAALENVESAQHLLAMLESWMDCASPDPVRYFYDTNLVAIQRILSLSWAWAFLAGRPEQESTEGLFLECRVLQIIEADVRFLEPRLGRSEPNNHFLADRFIRWYLELIFPEFLREIEPETEMLWCKELLSQTYLDGGSFEHSSHYHEFAVEMAAAYVILSERNGRFVDPDVASRLRSLMAYQCALTGRNANPLPLGNAIEDTLFPLDAEESWAAGAIREIYRSLYEPGVSPAPRDSSSVFRAFWLLGGKLVKANLIDVEEAPLHAFPQSGLFVMNDLIADTRFIFRTGSAPETTVSPGHMHADLLAVYVETDGQPLIVDSGTYTYRGDARVWASNEPRWRKYFAGPQAHNGISILDSDPLGEITRDFRRQDVQTRVGTTSVSDETIALVDATIYSSNVYDSTRRVCVHLQGEYLLILNIPCQKGSSSGVVQLGLQFSPLVSLRIKEYHVYADLPDRFSALSLSWYPPRIEPQIIVGGVDPTGGWVSGRYGAIQPAPQLIWLVKESDAVPAFLFNCLLDSPPFEILSIDSCCDARLVKLQLDDITDWLLIQPSASRFERGEFEGIIFDGELLWLRESLDGSRALRWLKATHLEWPGKSVNLKFRDGLPRNLCLVSGCQPGVSNEDFFKFEW
jgi:hypothetical protein